jgi:hypothetical protein
LNGDLFCGISANVANSPENQHSGPEAYNLSGIYGSAKVMPGYKNGPWIAKSLGTPKLFLHRAIDSADTLLIYE